MKKASFFILLLCLLVPIAVKAEKKPFGNGLYWELNSSGVLTISGTGDMPNFGYRGQQPWPEKGIRKVIIDYGVTSIGENAFMENYEDNTLLSVEIPSSVKTIGRAAFWECKRLSSIWIPSSVKTIGEDAFFKCESLSSINIPSSVTSIEDGAFLATGITSIVIPNSVRSIGEVAFAECINLKNISISESVISIGDDAFIGDEDDKCYEGIISLLPQWLLDKGTSEWRRCGLSAKSVEAFKRTNTPDAIIKRKGGYSNATELLNGNKKYYLVCKSERYGLTDAEGKIIVPTEMEALESAGAGYLRYKLNGFWGLMDYAGKILIDTNRGYTSIGDFKTFNKRFSYTMNGYKGECDINGRPVSKIKVATPVAKPTPATPKKEVTKVEETPKKQEGSKTQTIIVEHHRDPIPVQQWQDCWACCGSGKMGCDFCGGSGTKYIGDRLQRCPRCNMSGEIPCNICYGRKGQYITVYQ